MHELNILIPSIDSVKQKNIIQFNGLQNVRYFILPGIVQINLDEKIKKKCIVTPVGNGYFSYVLRINYILKYLIFKQIHLVELYPEGLPEFIYLLISKLFRKKVILIARGAEYYYLSNRFSRFKSFFFKLTFKYCDAILFRELYGENFIKSFDKKTFLIPNSVNVEESLLVKKEKFIFLYFNSFKSFRSPEILIDAFILFRSRMQSRKIDLQDCYLDIYGYDVGENTYSIEKVLTFVKMNPKVGIRVFPFSKDSVKIISESSVFLMPSTITYLNNALLEAMSFGVVPIISKAPNSKEIFNHGIEGIIVEDNPYLWADYMELLYLNKDFYDILSIQTRKCVELNFNKNDYLNSLNCAYNEILADEK